MEYNRATSRALWGCLMVVLSTGLPIFGQAPEADKQSSGRGGDDQSVICRLELVVVDIEVRDGNHWPVSDLSREHFVVLEDGKEQEIQYFLRRNEPNTADGQGQYQIAYYPPSKDGEYKRVRIKFREAKDVRDKGLSIFFSPKGYYAILRD